MRVVTYRGHSLRRKQTRSEVIWQSADACPVWGYWYSSARQAIAESNCSDRVIASGSQVERTRLRRAAQS